MYSGRKGKSGSHKPPFKITSRWVKYKKNEIEGLVVKLAKEKFSSAVIGSILKDQYGIPDVKALTGKTTQKIMIENNLYPAYPEDLMNLFKRVVNLRTHLNRNKADRHSLKQLENMESKIRRLIKYYKREGKVKKDFVYDPEKIKLIIQK